VQTKIVSLLGCSKDEAHRVLAAMGWRSVDVTGAVPVWRRTKEKPRRADPAKPRAQEVPANSHSPFAGLAALRIR
jgi:hypothetical protein